jgi:hypothetical protein
MRTCVLHGLLRAVIFSTSVTIRTGPPQFLTGTTLRNHTQVISQLRSALSISPLDTPGGRPMKWSSIQKALDGLRLDGLRPDAIGRVRTALLVLPGPLLPSLDRTSA